jgi:predicted nuclease of predicted toxin-antitoxin system
MKLKLDENLPRGLSAALARLGHDIHDVYEEGLVGRPDADIWEAAQREERLLLTQDLDFSDVRRFAPGRHHGVMLLRLSSPSRLDLLSRILQLFGQENVEGWKRSFVVATDRKIRVQRPEKQS